MLHDLVRYYEILESEDGSSIPKRGYGTANISFALNIDDDGNLINITSCKITSGDKTIARRMIVPEPVGRTCQIVPDFLFGNSSYVLGFDNKGKPDRAKECFESFKKHNISILRNAQCNEAEAVIRFLEKWNPDMALDNPCIQENLKEIYKGANFIFRHNGRDVHNAPSVKKAWMEYKNRSSGNPVLQCLVTGNLAPISIKHSYIKGVLKKNGQIESNGLLVCFNKRAYESFNKREKKGLNAPVSEYATFAYGQALNTLLADPANKIILGYTTVVFWAETTVKDYPEMVSLFLNSSQLYTEDESKKTVRSTLVEKVVREVLERISQGKIADIDEVYKNIIDPNTRFFILGLSLNKTRVYVRYYLSNSFGSLMDKIVQHYIDLAIEKQFTSELSHVPIEGILEETLSKTSDDKSVSTYLSTALMRAVLMGEDYPQSLYQTILLRIHAEHDINYCKAAIIKACLLRKARKNGSKTDKEVLTLSLNEETKNKAYRLGRLFAVLEHVQKKAVDDIETTIRDRYLSAACTTPASTFPTLLTRAQHHLSSISKDDYGSYVYFDKLIGEIMKPLDVENDPLPKTLSLDEQGLFYLGFYHQRNKLYETKDKQEKVTD